MQFLHIAHRTHGNRNSIRKSEHRNYTKKKKKKEVQLSLCLAGYLCKDFDILRNFLDFPILSNNKKKVYKFLLFPTSNFI